MMAVAIGICKTDHWHESPSPPHSNFPPFHATRTKSENEIDRKEGEKMEGESE